MLAARNPVLATETAGRDPAAVAAAAGAAGFTAGTARELVPTLEKAVATTRGGQSAVVNLVLST
jgi:thiamine pyrophosphate-dependent acetolactate synthase large subunit-like protein